MINEKELEQTKLSATKKDYYQIWNELISLARKISERWDPSSTNESDPGIVLLKVLTACADKLNYNIDKNILECFMPSAAQQQSMRKLCEMMGYNIKYYQSATTPVTISYIGSDAAIDLANNVTIPAFTTIIDEDNSVNYLTLTKAILTPTQKSVEVDCIEGQLETCETDNENIVTLSMLDDNNRYYLPESTIAENGIFVYSATTGDLTSTYEWAKVDNLNTESNGAYIYKFGFDSLESLPYVQFPDDVSSIIGDGLIIKYIRTKGINGNISAKTLTTIEAWDDDVDSTLFFAQNTSAAQNGADPETNTQAYNSFKKTVGTFDTLVTCRDYMNKIYQLYEDGDNIPLVSNAIVSDIRDDINRAITICGFDDYGVKYVDKPLFSETIHSYVNVSTFIATSPEAGTYYIFATEDNTYHKVIVPASGNHSDLQIDESTIQAINNFNIVLYPFKTIYGLNSKTEHDNSFNFSVSNIENIKSDLEDYKTISHQYIIPKNQNTDKISEDRQVALIKNYLKLNAKITTTYKVSTVEASTIISNIKKEIYSSFNMRQLDFGDEIPFDTIYEVIKNADERIKNVSLEEPTLYTWFSIAKNDGSAEEYDLASILNKSELSTDDEIATAEIYNKLALRNILAGRIELFDYNSSFSPSLTEEQYNKTITNLYPDETTKDAIPESLYPRSGYYISSMESEAKITLPTHELFSTDEPIKLSDNEVISFRAPNFKTEVTYPAYVNYYLHLGGGSSEAIPATMQTMKAYFTTRSTALTNITTDMFTEETTASTSTITYTISGTTATKDATATHAADHYEIKFDTDTFAAWNNWFKAQVENSITLSGIYRRYTQDLNRPLGKYIDANYIKYLELASFKSVTGDALAAYYVQETHSEETSSHTKDGLGKDAVLSAISSGTEYQLGPNEYLCINYTQSSSDSSDSTSTSSGTIINKKYTSGTIINPNFDLSDSAQVHSQGTSWAKKDGFDATWGIDGMLCLGSSEQIEIRKKVSVPIWSETTSGDTSQKTYYVYWILNSSSLTDNTFPWVSNKYTLQDGEYFFYTDENKLDMAYYGSGTEIVRSSSSVGVDKSDTSDEISLSEILTNGISAIPWIKVPLSDTLNITFNEYQYINLTKGDSLVTINIDQTQKDSLSSTEIDNDWRTISAASYKLDGSDDPTDLSALSCGEDKWQVRTKLEYNIGPNCKQTLRRETKTKNSRTWAVEDKISATETSNSSSTSTRTINFKAGNDNTTLTLKSNYLIQSSLQKQDTTWIIEDEDSEDKLINDFSLKVYKSDEDDELHYLNNGQLKSLVENNSTDNYWTTFSMSELTATTDYLTLNANILTNNYGLVMIYYNSTSTTATNNVYITSSYSSTYPTIKIFNYPDCTSETWWSGYTSGTAGTSADKYYLKPGLNIIKLENATTLKIYRGTSTDESIVFSSLDLIKITNSNKGINIDRLKYFNSTKSSGSASQTNASRAIQLLNDINSIDLKHEFYYNTHVEKALALNINYNLTDDDYESLATPRIWYDYNNVNNKFVISEIDSDELANGIIIEKTSKLN